jgi:hypothetical protein
MVPLAKGVPLLFSEKVKKIKLDDVDFLLDKNGKLGRKNAQLQRKRIGTGVRQLHFANTRFSSITLTGDTFIGPNLPDA